MESYNHLKVLEIVGRYRLCECSCGNVKQIRVDHLKSGRIVSCGCIGKKNSINAKITHGMTNSRVYKIWSGIIARCKDSVGMLPLRLRMAT